MSRWFKLANKLVFQSKQANMCPKYMSNHLGCFFWSLLVSQPNQLTSAQNQSKTGLGCFFSGLSCSPSLVSTWFSWLTSLSFSLSQMSAQNPSKTSKLDKAGLSSFPPAPIDNDQTIIYDITVLKQHMQQFVYPVLLV